MVKAVVVVTINDTCNGKQECDSTFNCFDNKLQSVNCKLFEVIEILPTDRQLPSKLENLLISYDYVVLFAGTETVHIELLEIISRIFHEKLVPNKKLEGFRSNKIPVHAKILENNTHNTRNSGNLVIFIQGLFVVSKDLDIQVLLEFLSMRNKTSLYKRIIYFVKQTNGLLKNLPTTESVTCNFEDHATFTKLILSSESIKDLLDVEDNIKNSYSNIVKYSEEGTIVDSIIYNHFSYDHIEKSYKSIEECFVKYGPEHVLLSFNGGKDCTVLLHLMLIVLQKRYPSYKRNFLTMYVQIPDSFEELEDFILECQSYYDLNIVTITRNVKDSLAYMLEIHQNLKACLMGTRRTDPFSENLEVFQMTDANWPQIMRVHPILNWHYQDVWDYLLDMHVPYCKLYDLGYTSLGSQRNTIQNPELKCDEAYLPAYKLFDASKERSGRK